MTAAYEHRGAMASRLTGTLYTFSTHALYVGSLVAVSRHQHHAGQLIWAPDGVDIAEESGPLRSVTTHVVAPHRAHRHGASPAAAVLWVDRDDLRWDRLAPMPPAPGVRVGPDGALAPDAASALADALLALVAPPPEARALARRRHPAVARMRRLLEASVEDDEVSVTDLARSSGLSARQLRHRFTGELGLAPSAYLRWRRLLRSLDAIERGASLTEGALAGGFADGAHFSRVFQSQFGLAPSLALSSLRVRGLAQRAARAAASASRR